MKGNMNSTINYLAEKFGLDVQKHPIEIHNINRTIMAQTLKELGFKVGVEVGVAQGWHAEILCRENPGVKLFAVDIWARYPGYNEYTDRIDEYYRQAKERLAPYNCEFVKKFSADAARDFQDGSLDFVYIDGAHDFKNAAIDICEWSKKVRVGGIVFGHDYQRWRRRRSIVDVKDVVQAFVYAHKIRPLFVLTNGIRDPKFGSDAPGWLFVREDSDLI